MQLSKGNLQSNKRMLAGLAVIAVLFLFAIWQYSDSFGVFWADEETIKQEIRNLKRLQKELEAAIAESRKLQLTRNTFEDLSKDFWLPSRDGKVETEVHKRIEQASNSAGLKLNSLGNFRKAKLTESFSMITLNLAAEEKMEIVSRFITELYKIHPRFYWDKCTLRPDNIRNPVNVRLTGTLMFVCVTENEESKKLIADKN